MMQRIWIILLLIGHWAVHNVQAQVMDCHNSAYTPSKVMFKGTSLMVSKVEPDGNLMPPRPYLIKGICWSPASERTQTFPADINNAEIRKSEFKDWFIQDLDLMKKMHINTVKTYLDFGLTGDALNILDECYRRDIMVVITVDHSINDTAQIRKVANLYKNHPAILMWCLGNEWNINYYYGVAKTTAEAADRTQKAAVLIKSLDLNHPVISSYGEIHINASGLRLEDTKRYVNTVCRAVDAWALNIFRGNTFGSLFYEWKSITSKPMMIGEFGTDAFNTTHTTPAIIGTINEGLQAEWDVNLWEDLANYASFYHLSQPCSGGFVFEWQDEWWKVPPFSSQQTDGHALNPFGHPDNFANEEYFGLVDIHRKTRAVYDSLAVRFNPDLTTAAKQFTIKVESGGFFVPGGRQGFAAFYLGNNPGKYVSDHRGFNVLALDTFSFRPLTKLENFDTWGSENEIRRLNNYLEDLPDGTMLLFAIKDEAGLNHLSSCSFKTSPPVETCLNLLKKLGSKKIMDYCYWNSWAMVSIKGSKQNLGETLTKDTVKAVVQITYPITRDRTTEPSAPDLIFPQCGFVSGDLIVPMFWESSGTSYQVQLSLSPSFKENLEDTLVTGKSFLFTSTTNLDTCYWRVRAINSKGNSRWSCPGYFILHKKPQLTVLKNKVTIPGDSLSIRYEFYQRLEKNNSFIIQLAEKQGLAFKTIKTFTGTASSGFFSLQLPDDLPCNPSYIIRIISTFPADTSVNSNAFEVLHTLPRPQIKLENNWLTTDSAELYSWYINGGVILQAHGRNIKPREAGNYQVKITRYGCESPLSEPYHYVLTSADASAIKPVISIFPNPCRDWIRLSQPEQMAFRSFKMVGPVSRTHLSGDLFEKSTVIKTDGLGPGCYILILTDKQGNTYSKVILKY